MTPERERVRAVRVKRGSGDGSSCVLLFNIGTYIKYSSILSNE
jgi:hypothetical protein